MRITAVPEESLFWTARVLPPLRSLANFFFSLDGLAAEERGSPSPLVPNPATMGEMTESRDYSPFSLFLVIFSF